MGDHRGGVLGLLNRVAALQATLREVLAEFRTAEQRGGVEYFTARVDAGRVDGWHRTLADTDRGRAHLDPGAAPPAGGVALGEGAAASAGRDPAAGHDSPSSDRPPEPP